MKDRIARSRRFPCGASGVARFFRRRTSMNDWQEAEQRVEKAQELFAQQRWVEALSELRAAISINPYNSGWHFNAGLTLDDIDVANVGPRAEEWEKVLRKIRAGQMPPVGRPRPDVAASSAFMGALETALERASSAAPNPGRPTMHRLNRTEYSNSVRDLLALEIDGRSLLPADDTDEHGFDNNADVLTVSPVLAARYLSAARKIGRLAVGRSTATTIEAYRLPRQLVQDDRLDEELQEDVRLGGAESFAHADLARPLGDRHEHDVHDRDAAHDEAHGCDAGEQAGECLGRVFQR